MNVNDMVAALAAKTVDAMVTSSPTTRSPRPTAIANTLAEFYDFDKMPVFMAATPDFVEKNPETVVAYLKAWLDVAKDFKDNPNKVADVIYAFYTSKGYTMSQDDLHQGAGARRGRTPASRPTSGPTCRSRPRSC